VRLVVEDHAVTDIGEDLADHMHQVHHCPKECVVDSTDEELDLMHSDDHDDLRRGIGG
jgi:hypothetical protein